MDWYTDYLGNVRSLPAQVRPEPLHPSMHRSGAAPYYEEPSDSWWSGPFRVAVLASHGFDDYKLAARKLTTVLQRKKVRLALTLGLGREDGLLRAAAERSACRVFTYPVDYKTYGKTAVAQARSEALDDAQALVAFWDGSEDHVHWAIEAAAAKGIPVRVFRF